MDRRNALQKAAMLLGGAFSAPTLLAMQHWQTNTLTKQFDITFTASQSHIIAEVAEMILPQTDTVGAKAVGVPAFIEMMLKDCYEQPEHLSFMEGLEALEKMNFLAQNEQKRTEILKKVEAETKELMKAYQVQQSKI
ncbi:MAG: gluconate 2-dehydrogenase subunit 3 family protein, partial [Spirosomataceae bacterium]